MIHASSVGFHALAERDYRLLFTQPVDDVAESLWWAGKFLQSWHTEVAIGLGITLEFKLEFHGVEGVPSEDVAGYANQVMSSFSSINPLLPFYSPDTAIQSLFLVYEILQSRFLHVSKLMNCTYEEAVYSIFEAYRAFTANPENQPFLSMRQDGEKGNNDDMLEAKESLS